MEMNGGEEVAHRTNGRAEMSNADVNADDRALFLLDALDVDLNIELDSSEMRTIEALASATVAEPPVGLLPEVLSAARQRRSAGPAHGSPPTAVTPSEAFLTTAADLHNVLLGLDDADWERPTRTAYGTVRDVVAHLIGIERLALGWYGALAMPPPELAGNHLAVSQAVIDEMSSRPVAEVRELWFETAQRVATTAATLAQDTFVMMHDIPGSVEASLLLRTFELWAHADDICDAVGMPLLAIDPSRLLLLSSRLVAVLPVAFDLAGDRAPDAVTRIVLTGAGGGTYDVPFGAAHPSSAPQATIITSAIDICRLAARRITPGSLPMSSEGDALLVDSVLAHVGAFSRD
jgi:uncharacterized protein (TIGR03083 family)